MNILTWLTFHRNLSLRYIVCPAREPRKADNEDADLRFTAMILKSLNVEASIKRRVLETVENIADILSKSQPPSSIFIPRNQRRKVDMDRVTFSAFLAL